MQPILEVKNLTKSFGAVVAAGDINVNIYENEIIAVIGSNGAGKTTFVNMVTGYLKPSSGKILFEGSDITAYPPRKVTRAGICRSFQIAQLFPELSVLENMMIAFSLTSSRWPSVLQALRNHQTEKNSFTVLKRFNIDMYANDPVASLAQGVRKLLDIAMAMVSKPSLLLLDEPTSGVAIEEKFELMDAVMNGVLQSGASTMFIEHDMDIVERYANRVIAFYEGRIIADGPTAEVLQEPTVKEFIVGEDITHQEGRNLNA